MNASDAENDGLSSELPAEALSPGGNMEALRAVITAAEQNAGRQGPVSKVKLNLRGRKDLALRSFVENHLSMIAKSPDFDDPEPPEEEMAAAYEEYADALNEWSRLHGLAKAATTRKKQARQKLEKMMVARGGFVQVRSKGNASKILGVGLGVAAEPSPVGLLMPPQGFRSELGSVAGRMLLRWKKVKDARGYVVEVSLDVKPREFRVIKVLSKTSLLLSDLNVGDKLIFRIATLGGANGMSPWSQELIRSVG